TRWSVTLSLTRVRLRFRHSETRQLALRSNFRWLYGTRTGGMRVFRDATCVREKLCL
ncbi:hypothetical protein GBAR_LOCUS26002, partial [Geodia barretti]